METLTRAQSQSEQKRLDSSCEDGRAETVLVPPVNERPELSFQRRGRQPGGAETSRYNLGGFILGGLTRLTSENVDETLLQSRVIGLYSDMNGNSLSKTGQETKWLRAGSSPCLSELYW